MAQADQLWEQFHELVNMSSKELRDWLAASEEVFNKRAPGVPREEPEGDLPSIGWQIVTVLDKRHMDLTPDDSKLMREVSDIISDRLDNPPPDGVNNDQWRRELMLLGHDPLREIR